MCGKGTKAALIPLPPAVGRAIDRAIGTRTTMRYDRACNNLDRHPSCILAAYMASGT